MFWGSPLLDFLLMLSMVFFLKHYLFLEDLNDEEKRFVLFSKSWVRILVVLSIFGEVSYVVGSDIALFEGRYYIHCLCASLVTSYFCALWGIYISYKYGPKNPEYKDSLEIRVQAAIALPCIFLLMYFFM